MAGKVVHFEIPVGDGGRAGDFYRRAFGWGVERWGPMDYWSVTAGEGEGIDGALLKRDDASPGLLVYIHVDDIAASLAEVEAAGGRALTEAMPIPGVGWSAHFEDTEGNRVGIFQPDPGAPVPEPGP